MDKVCNEEGHCQTMFAAGRGKGGQKFAARQGIARQCLPLGGAKGVTEVCRLLRFLSDLRTKSVKLISMEETGLTKVANVCRPKFVPTLC